MTNIYYKTYKDDESMSLDSFLIYISGIGIYLSEDSDLLRISSEQYNGYSIDDNTIGAYADLHGYHLVFKEYTNDDGSICKEWYTEFKDDEDRQKSFRNSMAEAAAIAQHKTQAINFQDQLIHYLISELVHI